MAEYYPLILKAVTALEQSTAQTRRALYDRARTALLTQLRAVEPALSEPDITRERLALEEAIRRVEVDAVMRQSDSVAPTARSADPLGTSPSGGPDAPPQTAPRSGQSQWMPDRAAVASPSDDRGDPGPLRPVTRTAAPQPPEPPQGSAADRGVERARWQADALSAPAGGDVKHHRDATETDRSLGAAVPSYPDIRANPAATYADDREAEPRLDGRTMAPVETGRMNQPEPAIRPPSPRTAGWLRGREPAVEAGLDGLARRQETTRPFTEHEEAPESPGDDLTASDWWNHTDAPPPFDDNEEEARGYAPADENLPGDVRGPEAKLPASAARRLSSRKRVLGLSIMALALVAAAAASIWRGPGIWTGEIGAAPRGAAGVGRPADQVIRSDGGARGKIVERLPTSSQGASESPTSAPRAVLYEIDQSNTDRFFGSVAWRTESAPAVPGQKPALTVRADIEIPEQHMTISWSLGRNDDPNLSASHTIEIVITLPPDFPHGDVSDIPGILMQQSEYTRGFRLTGDVVKVKNNFFLGGLSSYGPDVQQNIRFLKERSWIGISLRYTDGRQAIVAVEKGTSGERAFAAAFAAWGQ